jgi:hypothetical protein
MRINNTGAYEFCRWATKQDRTQGKNIHDQDPITWFQHGMAPIRQAMLDGTSVPGCSECDQMDQHGKVSGRQKQRLKIGLDPDKFEKSMLSTPWIDEFRYSSEKHGHSDLMPQDWQIDLGNFCNSACIFCHPNASSRLATEWKRIGFIDQLPARYEKAVKEPYVKGGKKDLEKNFDHAKLDSKRKNLHNVLWGGGGTDDRHADRRRGAQRLGSVTVQPDSGDATEHTCGHAGGQNDIAGQRRQRHIAVAGSRTACGHAGRGDCESVGIDEGHVPKPVG